VAAKLYERGEFNYKGERNYFAGRWVWTWYFRPVSCELFVEYHRPDGVNTRKADVEAFVDQGAAATQYYNQTLAQQGDVEVAKVGLEAARAQYARTRMPDYDPGGSANNPGKVSRVMSADSRLVPNAEARLQNAQRIAAVLATGNKRRA